MELAKLHVLVAKLDEAVTRLAEDFATAGSPPSGNGGGAGVYEGTSGGILSGREGFSEVRTADLLLPNFIPVLCRIGPSSLCERS